MPDARAGEGGAVAAVLAAQEAVDDGAFCALVDLIDDLTDQGECWFDHHGYCQEHAWMATDPPCPHARAKALMAKATEKGAWKSRYSDDD